MAAYFIEEHSTLGVTGTVLTVVVPVAVYLLLVFGLYSTLTRSVDPFHLLLVAASAVVIVASVVLASVGLSMQWCIAVLALTPWVTVVGYEVAGHRHNAEVLARL